jgi:hypothetical protein
VDTLYVGLSPWILADGNYKDFEVGQKRKFALEFHGPELQPSDTSDGPSLIWIDNAKYSAIGRVIFADAEVWVCDFGIAMAYDESPPAWVAVGLEVAGKIYLGIDHFSYFESLHDLPGMPALTYEFRVKRILVETIPLIFHQDQNRYTLADNGRTSREVNDTRRDPLRDPFDRTSTSHFVLECELLQGGLPPVTDMG